MGSSLHFFFFFSSSPDAFSRTAILLAVTSPFFSPSGRMDAMFDRSPFPFFPGVSRGSHHNKTAGSPSPSLPRLSGTIQQTSTDAESRPFFFSFSFFSPNGHERRCDVSLSLHPFLFLPFSFPMCSRAIDRLEREAFPLFFLFLSFPWAPVPGGRSLSLFSFSFPISAGAPVGRILFFLLLLGHDSKVELRFFFLSDGALRGAGKNFPFLFPFFFLT